MKIKNIVFLLAISLLSACTDSPTEPAGNTFAGRWKINIWAKQHDSYITVDGNVLTFMKYPFNGSFYDNTTFKGKLKIDSSNYDLDIRQINTDSIYGIFSVHLTYQGDLYYGIDTFSGIRIK